LVRRRRRAVAGPVWLAVPQLEAHPALDAHAGGRGPPHAGCRTL